MKKDPLPSSELTAEMSELRQLLLQKGLVNSWPYLSQFLPKLNGWLAAYDDPDTPDQAAQELIKQLQSCPGRPTPDDLGKMIALCDFVHYRARAKTGERWSPTEGSFLEFHAAHPDAVIYYNAVDNQAAADKTFIITQRLQQ